MERKILIWVVLSVFLISGCEEFLTGQVVGSGQDSTMMEPRYLRCNDGVGLNINDVCLEGEDELKVLVNNAGISTIDSMKFTFSDGNEESERRVGMGLEPGDTRVISARPHRDFGVVEAANLKPFYRSTDSLVRQCNTIDVNYPEVRECGQ